MTRLAIVVGVAALALAPLSAQQAAKPQEPPKTEAPKADAKETPSLTGKWALSIDTGQGIRQATLDLKIDGKKITGSVASEMGEAPITGEFAEGKLVFTLTMQGGSGDVQVGFVASLKEDGTLAGSLDFGQGEMPWTGSRIKEK